MSALPGERGVRLWAAAAIGAVLYLVGAAALAADTAIPAAYPTVSGTIPIEIQGDGIYKTEDDTDRHDVFTKIEPEIGIRLSETFSIEAGLTLEEVVDPDPADENRVFEDEGLYVKTLKAVFEHGRFAIFGGKFTPNFGTAHDGAIMPGLYGTDMAEDYELAERIGFGGSVRLAEGAWGKHALSASVFFHDTTALSGSAFRDRGRRRPASGGPSNTESLESFAVGLDGEDAGGVRGLHYHLAVVRQAVDRVNDDAGVAKAVDVIDDETGFATAFRYRFAAGRVRVTPIVEWVRLTNFGGDKNVDRDYVTAGLGLGWGAWSAAFAYTCRHTDNPSAADRTDYQVQVSGGYRFESGIGIEVGWKQIEENDLQSRFLGGKISYEYAF